MNIKEKAAEWQNKTEVTATQRDLLFYIIGRLDDIEKKLTNEQEEVAKVKTQVKMICVVFPSIIGLLLYICTL